MPCGSKARASGPPTPRQVLGEPGTPQHPLSPEGRKAAHGSCSFLSPQFLICSFLASPNSGPRMFLLSSNFLFAFGLDSVPPRLWEALHLSFSSEECFLPWIQHLQSHLWFSAYISGFLPPSPCLGVWANLFNLLLFPVCGFLGKSHFVFCFT